MPRHSLSDARLYLCVDAREREGDLAEFLDDGEITLGLLEPVGCVAVAADGHNSLAMLVRRNNETMTQLLVRLDQAVGLALAEDIFTDEING